MFSWLSDIIGGMGEAMGDIIKILGTELSNVIFDSLLQWLYTMIYDAIADFFTMMGNMGADIFDLQWVKATVELFTLFGWSLFVAGTAVAVFDLAIEYQSGRANPKFTMLNILKGFFACSLTGVLPVELYKFCISLQNTFAGDLTRIFAGQQSLGLSGMSTSVLEGCFRVDTELHLSFLNFLGMLAFGYCVVKIFFANISRGDSADSDDRRFAVYVQRAEGLHRRLQPVDEAGRGDLPDRFYADHLAFFGAADLRGQYAAGARHYAGGQRSAAHRAAVRS